MMEMTSATAMMTSFISKASQTNNHSSRNSASSHLETVSHASVSRSQLSSTAASVSVPPAANIATSSSFVTSLPASSTPPAKHKVTTPLPPQVSQTSLQPSAKSVQSPQFSLKQGAMSVQGLLGQESFSSKPLQTASSGAQSINSASAPVNTLTQSVAEAPFANAQAGTTTQSSARQPEQGKASETVKPTAAENFATIYGDDSSDQAVTEEATDEDLGQTTSAQNEVDANTADDSNVNQARAEQEAEKQQRQEASRQQEQQIAQKAQQVEAALIDKLSKRDTEVRTHEQAHASVGGVHAQSPSFSYEKGPDGRRYAVDGEVQIDVSVVNGDAQATLNKMMKVYSAAMAPVQPSMADIRVAAEALQKMNAAREELAIERQQGVIKLDDADHIIGLGAKIKNTQEEEQVSQLEPFKRKASDANIYVDGIDKASDSASVRATATRVQSNATLAYQAFNANLARTERQASNVNAYV